MKRRSRSGMACNREEAEKMSLADLESDIERCEWGAQNRGSSQGRKAFFKRLIWLEQQRESLFDIPAPKRKLRQFTHD